MKLLIKSYSLLTVKLVQRSCCPHTPLHHSPIPYSMHPHCMEQWTQRKAPEPWWCHTSKLWVYSCVTKLANALFLLKMTDYSFSLNTLSIVFFPHLLSPLKLPWAIRDHELTNLVAHHTSPHQTQPHWWARWLYYNMQLYVLGNHSWPIFPFVLLLSPQGWLSLQDIFLFKINL